MGVPGAAAGDQAGGRGRAPGCADLAPASGREVRWTELSLWS